jgi:phospholipid/cholesterol/gamma-HCH transport system substrate-binding protein
MQKQAPSVGRIFVMVLFALSCFGILLYLWLVFGGSTPLKPQGYRFDVNFPEATQLAQEADVRISGVPVGRVKTKELDETDDSTTVEIELDEQYAPIPADTRAILRQKTLLGETYVELTQGS